MSSGNRVRRSYGPALWALATVGLTFAIYAGLRRRFPAQYLDAAGFGDLLTGRGINVRLESSFFASVYPYFDLYGASAARACASVLSTGADVASLWRAHAYAVVMPLSALASAMSVPGILVGLLAIALSLAVFLLAPLYYLVRRRVPAGWTTAFAVLVVLWPVFSMGVLGQPYFDRLFPGFAVIATLGTWAALKRRASLAWIPVVGIVAGACISERGALMGALIGIVYPICLVGGRVVKSRASWLIMASGLASGIWFLIWNFVIENFAYYGGMGPSSMLSSLQRLVTAPGSGRFFVLMAMVIPLLALVALSPRGLPLALLSVAPNLLVTIGGAELDGFTTHYHQLYMPILVALAAVGVADASQRWRVALPSQDGRKYLVSRVAPWVVSIAVLALWSQAESPAAGIEGLFRNTSQALGRYTTSAGTALDADVSLRRAVVDAPPLVGTVSAPESLAPALLQAGVRLYALFPFGVGTVPKVYAPYVGESSLPNVFPYGVPPVDPQRLGACVQAALNQQYRRDQTVGPVGIFSKR